MSAELAMARAPAQRDAGDADGGRGVCRQGRTDIGTSPLTLGGKAAARPVDIIIPLSCESVDNRDEELKVFLRSLAENAVGWDRIILVAAAWPEWLRADGRLEVVRMDDPFRANKDANLFRKVREGLKRTDKEWAVFSADDCAVCRRVDFSSLPPIYNERGIAAVERAAVDGGKWTKKLARTMRHVGMLDGNWDSHVPQRWPVLAALAAIRHAEAEWAVEDYRNEGLGLTLCTGILGAVYGGRIPAGAVAQSVAKETVESDAAAANARLDRTFCCWNDAGWRGGLRGRLFEMFPAKSRWEK